MTEIEIASWQLNNEFSPKVVAALIMGITPHQVIDDKTNPVLHLMRKDYESAVYAHMAIISEPYDRAKVPRELKNLLKTSLKSEVMIRNINRQRSDPSFNEHDMWSWLTCNSKEPGQWNRSNFDEQEFGRDEIVRWLKVNNISSVFLFDRAAQEMPTENGEANKAKTTSGNNKNIKAYQPVISNEPTHDPLPLNGIALIFKIVHDVGKNNDEWKLLAKAAVRNGLISARVKAGRGTAQSIFDPVAVGEWLVKSGKIDQAKVERILNSNLPSRSAHLRNLYN